ncbi:LysR family transcriptional regulator [Reinekea marinisedimentorum]|uniref:DNA-binding transcriptional LysR family regulator n=1 Tax=Reinekea marinisedimentorum TaxID=230495 RepID=A0A4R3I0B4_9GAMM|nr:LysR family transcriptional regulator [Reinekea marinisedimentorum]TCS38972.1 DNA-binding transcriptional LysR family regulator [Reinekea marinisedimentorum]
MNSDQLNWENIRLFLAVAEHGSFSAAARELALGQPTLSRRIAEFESDIGGPLFSRKSQGCELTPLGLRLLPAAEQMALWSSDALSQLLPSSEVSGRVRITAPPGVALVVLTSFARHLQTELPEIQLEVLSTVDTLNLARGEADLALRAQPPSDENLVVLKTLIGDYRAYVAEDVAKILPEHLTAADLNWICWPDRFDYMQLNRSLKKHIKNFKPVFTSDDFNVQISACCNGVGALVLPSGFEQFELLSGLRPVNVALDVSTEVAMYLLVHKRLQYLPRVKKVSDELQAFLAGLWPEG